MSEEAVMTTHAIRQKKTVYETSAEEDAALMQIFESTYGKIKERRVAEKTENSAPVAKKEKPSKQKPKGDSYIIIDGYNMIFAWDFLKKSAEGDLALGRDILTRLMCGYTAFYKCKAIIVFDAYKRRGGEGSVERLGDVTVVYTKERQTADSYIEKTAYDIANKNTVRVVTSDLEEQLIILGVGALRVSCREFAMELDRFSADVREAIENLR